MSAEKLKDAAQNTNLYPLHYHQISAIHPPEAKLNTCAQSHLFSVVVMHQVREEDVVVPEPSLDSDEHLPGTFVDNSLLELLVRLVVCLFLLDTNTEVGGHKIIRRHECGKFYDLSVRHKSSCFHGSDKEQNGCE